jgi:hypothetical protein
MTDPTTPKEMLEHLAKIVADETSYPIFEADIQLAIREFNRIAGLDRTWHDLRENAYDTAMFLRNMGEVEL